LALLRINEFTLLVHSPPTLHFQSRCYWYATQLSSRLSFQFPHSDYNQGTKELTYSTYSTLVAPAFRSGKAKNKTRGFSQTYSQRVPRVRGIKMWTTQKIFLLYYATIPLLWRALWRGASPPPLPLGERLGEGLYPHTHCAYRKNSSLCAKINPFHPSPFMERGRG